MRYLAVGLFSFIAFSCRELDPLAESQVINGYQLNGKVTTVNGVPISDVTVKLYYYYAFASDIPLDTIQVIVSDSAATVDISVFSARDRFVRTIFSGRWGRIGTIPRIIWDGRDWNNEPVPSGMYHIRYMVDAAVVKSPSVIIEGNTTAVTDDGGEFTLTDDMLPVDLMFDDYGWDGTFYGVTKILPTIAIGLYKNGSYAEYSSIELTKNTIKTLGFTLQ